MQLLNLRSGVLESNLTHLKKRLLLGLDTFKKRRIGEFELVVLSGFKSVVRFSLGNCLNKGLEVTPVTLEFETVEVKNIGDSVVEEARVVRDND